MNDQEFSSGQEPSVSLHVYGEQAGGMGRGVKVPCFSFQASLGASRPSRPSPSRGVQRGGRVGGTAGAPARKQGHGVVRPALPLEGPHADVTPRGCEGRG